MTQVLSILQKEISSKYVIFDPNDPRHLEAYYSLRFKGRQDPNLRFFLEEPFLDVVSMMQHKIATAFLKSKLDKSESELTYA